MICPKCGKNVEDANFCSYCGAELTGEKAEGYSENQPGKKESAASLVAFIIALLVPSMNLVRVITSGGTFAGLLNGFFFEIPFFYIGVIYSLLDAGTILFTCLFRNSRKNGYGIAAIVFAAVIKLMHPFGFVSLVGLAAVVTLFVVQGKN